MIIFEGAIDIGPVKMTGYHYENMLRPDVWLEYEEYHSYGGSSTRTVDISRGEAEKIIQFLKTAYNL